MLPIALGGSLVVFREINLPKLTFVVPFVFIEHTLASRRRIDVLIDLGGGFEVFGLRSSVRRLGTVARDPWW